MMVLMVVALIGVQSFAVSAGPTGPQLSVQYADESGNPTSDDINYNQIDSSRDLICSINYVMNRQTGDWDYVNDPAEDVFKYYWKKLGSAPIQSRTLPSEYTSEGDVWMCDVYGKLYDDNGNVVRDNVLLVSQDQYFNLYVSAEEVVIPPYLDAQVYPAKPTVDDNLTCGAEQESNVNYFWYEYSSLTDFPDYPIHNGYQLDTAVTKPHYYYQCVASHDGSSDASSLRQIDVTTNKVATVADVIVTDNETTCQFEGGEAIDTAQYSIRWYKNDVSYLPLNDQATALKSTFGGWAIDDTLRCDVSTKVYGKTVSSADVEVDPVPSATPLELSDFTTDPAQGDIGTPFTFGVTFTDPENLAIDTFSMTIDGSDVYSVSDGTLVATGDGNYANGEVFETSGAITGFLRGNHTVRFDVISDDGRHINETYTFTVDNYVPQISNVPVDIEVAYGTSITLDIEALDLDNDNLSYQITPAEGFVQDGTDETIFRWHTTQADVGVYDLEVRVSDGIDVGTQSFTVNVTGEPLPADDAPEVTFVNPTDGMSLASGATVNFQATVTDTEDGTLPASNIVWYAEHTTNASLSPGPFGNGQSFSHALDPSVWPLGTYNISVIAVDSAMQSTEESILVDVVEDADPTITFESPADGATFHIGDFVDFRAQATDTEDGDLSSSIEWYSNINGYLGTGANVQMVLDGTDLDVGVHTISARVTDSVGQETVVNRTITVLPGDFESVDVIMKVVPQYGDSPLTVYYEATPINGTPLSYVWDLNGNGKIDSTKQSGTFTYHESGQFTAQLNVEFGTENNIQTVTKQTVVNITQPEMAPEIYLSTSRTNGGYPLDVEFTIDARGNGPFTYLWDFDGDGETDRTDSDVSRQFDVEHEYDDVDEYEMTVTVVDKNGVSTTETVPITVENRRPKTRFGRIIHDDVYTPGETARIAIQFDSFGNVDIDDARLTVMVDELGIMSFVGPFDISRSGERTKEVFVEIPSYAPVGEYDMRVVLSNDEFTRTKYRPITITE